MKPRKEEEAGGELSVTEKFLVDMHRLYPQKTFRPEDLRVHLTVTSLKTIT